MCFKSHGSVPVVFVNFELKGTFEPVPELTVGVRLLQIVKLKNIYLQAKNGGGGKAIYHYRHSYLTVLFFFLNGFSYIVCRMY